MEALTFLKFWKPILFPTSNEIPYLQTKPDSEEEEPEIEEEEDGEDEDSFFDLELITSPQFHKTTNNDNAFHQTQNHNDKFVPNEDKQNHFSKPDKNTKPCFKKQSIPVSTTPDPISKRKIRPIEPSSKPQSPIALLKSAPKFPVLIFKKDKSISTQKTEKTEEKETECMKKQTKQEGKIITFKLIRENSSRKQNSEDPRSETSSKRFSKEAMQKYLKLIKPLYEKVSKKNGEKTKCSDDFSMSSSSYPSFVSVGSPMKEKGNTPSGILRHLGKSKSASATAGGTVLPQNRRDDSLLQQHDGIQSAILHCKRSFHASRDCSMLEGQ